MQEAAARRQLKLAEMVSSVNFSPRPNEKRTAQSRLTKKSGMVNYSMTELNKPVRRRTRRRYSVLYIGDRKARQIVVELQPGDVLEFRELGRRGRWQLAIDSAFRYAVRMRALAECAQRRRLRI
jgi:hypothetical protein